MSNNLDFEQDLPAITELVSRLESATQGQSTPIINEELAHGLAKELPLLITCINTMHDRLTKLEESQ